ncbi:hypothetical protein DH09_11435 [Bacillaceae bacterium JMAK1]|nr:hypothetical protein DH09_11435 [Bacillaceae bacterium JMAK1]
MLTGDQKKKQKAKYSVPAVDSAFRILRLLSRKKFSDSTVTEIANALELQPTTCFRILQQLKESSIVTFHEKSKRYRLGPYLVVLGERAKENSLDLALVLPYLEKISENTGLTSVIVSRVGKMKTTIVAKVEGGDFGVHVSVGRHFSIEAGAYGKCLLAYMPPEEQQDIFRELHESDTFEDVSKIEQELPSVVEKGYATNYGESIEGIFGVAAPIFNVNHDVEMSICLFGMTARLKQDELEELGSYLHSVSKEISRKIQGAEQF